MPKTGYLTRMTPPTPTTPHEEHIANTQLLKLDNSEGSTRRVAGYTGLPCFGAPRRCTCRSIPSFRHEGRCCIGSRNSWTAYRNRRLHASGSRRRPARKSTNRAGDWGKPIRTSVKAVAPCFCPRTIFTLNRGIRSAGGVTRASQWQRHSRPRRKP